MRAAAGEASGPVPSSNEYRLRRRPRLSEPPAFVTKDEKTNTGLVKLSFALRTSCEKSGKARAFMLIPDAFGNCDKGPRGDT
jgi:hypothetical protein